MYILSFMLSMGCVKKSSTEPLSSAQNSRLTAQEGANEEGSGEIGDAHREEHEKPSGVVLGALAKGLIDAEVGQHLSSIQGCYEQELENSPSLSGRIVVKFVIAIDGSVSKATLKEDAVGSEVVTQCILDQFMKMQFPEPTGGGIVIVSYPFVFSPA